MPLVLKPGDMVRSPLTSYEIVQVLNMGNFANAFEARRGSDGQRIFLKQYIDPTPYMGEVYQKFVEHQKKVKLILDTLTVVEENYEFFESSNCYYQAKEFMIGKDLRSALDDKTQPLTDEQRFAIATVMMYAIRLLHDAKIVHTDLKPEQIYLEEKPETFLKYSVKIVDFDFCRIVGESDPIYICSTPFYESPEHIQGKLPEKASDIFTCGIILCELLGGQHPLHEAPDVETYRKHVLSQKATRLKAMNSKIPDSLDELVWNMLNPDPSVRPTAQEVHATLLDIIQEIRKQGSAERALGFLQKGEHPEVEPEKKEEEVPEHERSVEAESRAEVAPSSKVPTRIRLDAEGIRFPLRIHKTSIIGRDDFRVYGEFYKYVSGQQFIVIKDSEGFWLEGLETTNPTYINGKKLEKGQRVRLEEGSVIEIAGKELIVHFEFESS